MKILVNLGMTTLELKTKIHKVVDSISEDALPKILEYLESVHEGTLAYDNIDKIIDKIIEQEDSLLRRLAE